MSISPLESLGVQFWDNVLSPEIPSDEPLSTVRSLLTCPTNIAVARSLQGDEAQRLIDFLDQVSRFCSLDIDS